MSHITSVIIEHKPWLLPSQIEEAPTGTHYYTWPWDKLDPSLRCWPREQSPGGLNNTRQSVSQEKTLTCLLGGRKEGRTPNSCPLLPSVGELPTPCKLSGAPFIGQRYPLPQVLWSSPLVFRPLTSACQCTCLTFLPFLISLPTFSHPIASRDCAHRKVFIHAVLPRPLFSWPITSTLNKHDLVLLWPHFYLQACEWHLFHSVSC